MPLSLNEQILSTIDMMTAQHIQHVTLPAKALEEMRQMAKDRQKGIPSPRGAAEFNFHDAAKEVACGGSNDDDVEQKSELSADVLHQMTCTFLCQIIKSSVTMTEHCFRMTIQPADVARAKELFAANHEDADEDWAEEEEADEDDETMDDEEEAEEKDDDALFYDGSDNEEESHNDDVYIEDKYPQHNAFTPMFDAAYPPVGEIVHLTDTLFSEKILVPLMRDVTNSDIPLAEGVDGMFLRATYAFVVATLCANNE
ncbi:hypothetical protein QTG54_005699 [Skeletonema marinoi]|uniref:Uncharacterized protein n=1 Tax=Skeletonema marinoi TaxID=267567 RepID=A0AAD9DED3_9STRA|nr:hypothetical protein QTG54_005699 [Skeletonema marinoi]